VNFTLSRWGSTRSTQSDTQQSATQVPTRPATRRDVSLRSPRITPGCPYITPGRLRITPGHPRITPGHPRNTRQHTRNTQRRPSNRPATTLEGSHDTTKRPATRLEASRDISRGALPYCFAAELLLSLNFITIARQILVYRGLEIFSKAERRMFVE